MVSTQQAQIQLDELKHGVIGLFKHRDSDIFDLVTDINRDSSIDTIRITQFGEIQQEYNIPLQSYYGTTKLFPDNKTMADMLEDPFLWSNFVITFKK